MGRQPKIDKKRQMTPKPGNKSGENPYLSGSEPNPEAAGILPLTYLAMKAMGHKGPSPYEKKKRREEKESQGYSCGGTVKHGYEYGGDVRYNNKGKCY